MSEVCYVCLLSFSERKILFFKFHFCCAVVFKMATAQHWLIICYAIIRYTSKF